MTLRNRLLFALLALALIPTATFSLFTLDQLSRSIDHWYRPGVSRALEAGLEIGKGSLARFETMLAMQADQWAERWRGTPTPELTRNWAKILEGTGVDFVQIYRRDATGRWRLLAQVVPRGTLAATPLDLAEDIGPALGSGKALKSPRGALAAVSPSHGGDAVVAGLRMPPGFFEQVENLGQGAVHYRQLGVYVELQRRVYAILVSAIFVLVAVIAWFLSVAIARTTALPLQTLSAAFERVAAGNLDTRVTPAGAHELRSLGVSFNEMTQRLEAARTSQQVAEREAAWRDVARKLAHEFKNILTPMQLSLQLVDAQVESVPEPGRDSFRRSLSSTLREVAHLNRLAEQFSQYARLPEPQFEALDLVEIVHALLQANRGTLEPIACRSLGPVLVRGDRLLLSRAIHNLALNAREASPAGAVVEIEIEADEGCVKLRVLDCGPGIPADLQNRLFEPYVSTKRRGSGLGLSLVRDIVRQHGGTITVENRAPGGACAEVSLPLPDARSASPATA